MAKRNWFDRKGALLRVQHYLRTVGPFDTYEDFLLNGATNLDLKYLEYIPAIEQVVTDQKEEYKINREEFYKRKQEIKKYLNEISVKVEPCFDPKISNLDPLLIELGNRERANRVGMLSTIIHLSFSKNGRTKSAYIDYTERLNTMNWKSIFQGKKLLQPSKNDLSFYDWKTGTPCSNDSLCFTTLCTMNGLFFVHRFDRTTIDVNPKHHPGTNTVRKIIKTNIPEYDYVIFLDHVVRQRF